MNSGNITKLTYLDGYGQTGRSFLRESILRLMEQVVQRRSLFSSTV